MSSPKSLKHSNKDLSGKRVAIDTARRVVSFRAKASGLRAGKAARAPKTRQGVLDGLKRHLCDIFEDELAALGERFATVAFAFSTGDGGDDLDIEAVFSDDLHIMTFCMRWGREKVRLATSDVAIDNKVIDYAHEFLTDAWAWVTKSAQKWAECDDKDGPSEFVIPLRD